MKSTSLIVISLLAAATDAFSLSSGFGGSKLSGVSNGKATIMEYIPSGMSKEQWKKLQEKERNRNKGKNLGKVGITSFKSRSFAEWQKSGGKNLFPVDPKSVKSAKELPYMQRPGGSADDNDLEGKGLFSFFKKKKEPEPEPEEPKTNWWTL